MRLTLATFAILVLHAATVRHVQLTTGELQEMVAEPEANNDDALDIAWYNLQPKVRYRSPTNDEVVIRQPKIRADVGGIYQGSVCICRKRSLTHDCNSDKGARSHWLTAKDGQESSIVKEQYVCCQWQPWPDGISLKVTPTKETANTIKETEQFQLLKSGHDDKPNRMTYYPSFCFSGFNTPMDACPMNEEGTAPVARAKAETFAKLLKMKKKYVAKELVPNVKLWMRQQMKWVKAHPKEFAWRVFKFAGKLAFRAVGVAVVVGAITICPECLAAFLVGKIALAVVHLLVTHYLKSGKGKAGVQVIGVTVEATAALLNFIVPGADDIMQGVGNAASAVAAAFPAKLMGYKPNTFWEELAVQCHTAEVLSEDTPLQLASLLLDEEARKKVLFEIDKNRAGFVKKVRLRWKGQTDEMGARLDERMVVELEEQIHALQSASSIGHVFRCDFVLSQVYESMDTIKKYVAWMNGGESFEPDIVQRNVPNGRFCDSFEVD